MIEQYQSQLSWSSFDFNNMIGIKIKRGDWAKSARFTIDGKAYAGVGNVPDKVNHIKDAEIVCAFLAGWCDGRGAASVKLAARS